MRGARDTDGLYGVGIFPISRTGEARTLVIEREWVDIQLGRDARRETRRYQIVNEGPAGHFEIGWICTVNALDRHGPCTRMSVDGRAVSLAFRNGLVRDPDFGSVFQKIERPPRVEVMERDREQLLVSLAHGDGTIEAQSWASASIEFGAGSAAERFRASSSDSRSWAARSIPSCSVYDPISWSRRASRATAARWCGACVTTRCRRRVRQGTTGGCPSIRAARGNPGRS